MTDFYKMDPGAWDFGTSKLSLEEEAAYLRIVNAIHKHKGPVPNIDKVLAGMFRTSTRKSRSLIDALVKAEKIEIEDGLIFNERAVSDLVRRGFTSVSRAVQGSKGGRTRAENAAKALKEKQEAEAIASTRGEERREEKEEEYAGATFPDSADDFFMSVLHLLGIDRGQRIPTHWMPPAATIHVNGWLKLLPEGEILECIRQTQLHFTEPPNGPKAFDAALQRYAIAKSTPTLTAITGGRNDQSADAKAERLRRIIEAAAEGTSGDGWG